MKNGCCWAAVELRYCSAPSVPSAGVPTEFDEAAVVVDEAAAGLGHALVGAGVGRVPAREAVLFEVGGLRVEPLAGFEQCHLPL